MEDQEQDVLERIENQLREWEAPGPTYIKLRSLKQLLEDARDEIKEYRIINQF